MLIQGRRNKMDLLIKNGTLITMDPKRKIIEDGALAIEGDKIIEVGKSSELESSHSYDRIIDAIRKVVMPGLMFNIVDA